MNCNPIRAVRRALIRMGFVKKPVPRYTIADLMTPAVFDRYQHLNGKVLPPMMPGTFNPRKD